MKQQIIITLGREHGSGGHYIADIISKELGIKLYDKDSIEKEIASAGYSEEMIRKMDERRFVTQREAFNMYGRLNIEVLLKSDAIKPFSVATRDALDKEGNPLVVRKGNIYLSIAEIERAMRLHNLYAGV